MERLNENRLQAQRPSANDLFLPVPLLDSYEIKVFGSGVACGWAAKEQWKGGLWESQE